MENSTSLVNVAKMYEQVQNFQDEFNEGNFEELEPNPYPYELKVIKSEDVDEEKWRVFGVVNYINDSSDYNELDTLHRVIYNLIFNYFECETLMHFAKKFKVDNIFLLDDNNLNIIINELSEVLN